MNNDYIAHYGNTAGSTIFESAVKNESIRSEKLNP